MDYDSTFHAIGLTHRSVRASTQALFDRVLPALIWLWFAYLTVNAINQAVANQEDWLVTIRLGSNLIFALLIVVLFVIRHGRKGKRAKPREALVAIAGTFAMILLALPQQTHQSAWLLTVGTTLGLVGFVWSIVSLAILGRCFGIFPEARGLVTQGPYRIVRHPLYLGEIVIAFGVLLPVISPMTIAIWAFVVALQLRRAINEERVLSATFAEYSNYMQRTKRLIPFVW